MFSLLHLQSLGIPAELQRCRFIFNKCHPIFYRQLLHFLCFVLDHLCNQPQCSTTHRFSKFLVPSSACFIKDRLLQHLLPALILSVTHRYIRATYSNFIKNMFFLACIRKWPLRYHQKSLQSKYSNFSCFSSVQGPTDANTFSPCF